MNDDEFLESWTPLEASLRALETRYRSERLRPKGKGKPYPEGVELDGLLHALTSVCELYIGATGEQRGVMRDLFAWSYLLPQYLFRLIKIQIEHLPPEQAAHDARIALAAVSLEDNKTDYRDTFMALGSIYLGIVEQGLDTEALFQEAASWSSDTSSSGAGRKSMKSFLLNFKKTDFFRLDVEPRMRRG
jgi:hypothetical protein